jgi:hypothetical protein
MHGKNGSYRTAGVAQVVERLPRTLDALSSNSSTFKKKKKKRMAFINHSI